MIHNLQMIYKENNTLISKYSKVKMCFYRIGI